MTLRVVAWSTGNVGRHAVAGIDAHPDLELVGAWVSSQAKDGVDVGTCAGLGRELGVTATTDAAALLALEPDVIVHTALADHRILEALADLRSFLRAGIDVVSSSPVCLQYPYGVVPERLYGPVVEAAVAGGASLFVNGVDPGFANDALALVLSGVSERIEQVRCSEICNYATYDSRTVVFDVMGFGGSLAEVPMLLQPGVLTMAWGSVVRQLAAGLGVELDSVEESVERIAADDDITIDAGVIARGTQAGLRFEVSGMKDGRPVVVLEHVTRMRDDQRPDWPQPAGTSCYRVEIIGEPHYTLDLQLVGGDGDHNTAGSKATAMRLVNAIPYVVEAEPGLVTALDLPMITGRGLVRTT